MHKTHLQRRWYFRGSTLISCSKHRNEVKTDMDTEQKPFPIPTNSRTSSQCPASFHQPDALCAVLLRLL